MILREVVLFSSLIKMDFVISSEDMELVESGMIELNLPGSAGSIQPAGACSPVAAYAECPASPFNTQTETSCIPYLNYDKV